MTTVAGVCDTRAMAEEHDEAEEKLKVELPSLFGRKKRRGGDAGGGAPEVEAPRQPFEDEPADVDEAAPVPPPVAPSGGGSSRFAPPDDGRAALVEAEAEAEQARPVFRDQVPSTGSTADGGAVSTGSTTDVGEPPATRKPRRPVPPLLAAAGVGLFVGILACGLTYLGMIACQEIQGTTACGTPGFFVLMAIVVMLVAVGGFLLAVLRVPDAMSTSFLAVAVLAVVALAFLIEVIFEWWMILVIPVLAGLLFAGSHWVTRTISSTELEDV